MTRTAFDDARILEFLVEPYRYAEKLDFSGFNFSSLAAVEDNGAMISYCTKHPKQNVADIAVHKPQIIQEGKPIFFSYDVLVTVKYENIRV